MIYFEKDDEIQAISIVQNILGRKNVSFYSADKEKLSKSYRNRFVLGSVILAASLIIPHFLISSFVWASVSGVILFVMLCIFSSLDGVSVLDLFSKDCAMKKFQVNSKLHRASYSDNVAVCSEMFSVHGTAGFWERFLNNNNVDIFQEAVEIARQEVVLTEAITGMKEYINTTSKSAIRDEVFRKLEEANGKKSSLIRRFNNFEETVLQSSDAKRDGEVLQHMLAIDELDTEAA